MKKILPIVFLLTTLSSYSQTMGFFYKDPEALNGYVLIPPGSSDTTYLIDKCGKKVHTWTSTYNPGLTSYLLNDGSLVRAGAVGNNDFMGGGAGGIVEEYDWNGNLLWSHKISDANQCQHHDAMPLPNGNVIAIVWESYTKDSAIANGRKSSNIGTEMWSDKLVELKPDGNGGATEVWVWRAWDHMVQEYDETKQNYGVVKDHPELIDINLGTLSNFSADWLHVNGLSYDSVHDQILMSTHNLSELWIIDHSTTTDEAAGHTGGKAGKGGDFLYRWGNPLNYQRGTSDDRRIYQQHNPTFVNKGCPGYGDITVFNNGVGQPGQDYSTIVEFTPPEMVGYNYPLDADSAYQPKQNTWVYTATPPNSFNSFVEGGAQRLTNGNTLICEATSGELFEVDSLSNEVWRYIVPIGMNGKPLTQGNNPTGNTLFRATHIPFDHPGLAGKDLTPGSPIEKNPLVYDCSNDLPTGVSTFASQTRILMAYPNPFKNSFSILVAQIVKNGILEVRDATGRLLLDQKNFTSFPGQPNLITIPEYRGIVIVTVNDFSGKNIWRGTAIAQ